MIGRALAAPVAFVIVCGVASLADAQPSKTPPSKPAPSPTKAALPATKPAPPPTRGSAIVRIAGDVSEALGKVPSGTLVVVSPLASDIPPTKGDELALRVAAQIAGRLGTVDVHPQPSSLALARGVSGRAAALVYVQLEVVKGELRATADLYPVVSNSWDRLRHPTPGPQAHAFAGAPIDAEVRTFYPPIVLEQASVKKIPHEEPDVLAIGCGDIDADGGNELVLASRSRVVVGKLVKDKLTAIRSAPWSQLASRAPIPMREPTASIVVDERRGEVLVGTSDRGAVAVDSFLVVRRHLAGLPIAGTSGDVCALALPELGAFDGNAVDCQPPKSGDPLPIFALPGAPFDAASLLELVAKDGTASQVAAAREPNGKLRLRRTDANGKAAELSIDGTGAQVVLADLDLDGTPEVAFSGDIPDADLLSIGSWPPSGASGITQRLRLPTKEPIRALAACPPEERGVPALVAVVGSEIWLVR